jgi:hypothetical protein
MKDSDLEYWRQLYETYKESAQQFDKQILYISSGALGVSMSFITDIVEMKLASHKFLLSISWIVLAFIILVSLTSHYISMKALNYKMENRNNDGDKKSSFYNGIVSKLNVIMLLGLPIGIILLICFITLNI